MSADVEHVLDRRSKLLAEAILHNIAVMVSILKPTGGAAPFTDQLTSADALAWWKKNRYEAEGKAVASRLSPQQVAEIDAWLARELNKPTGQAPLLP